MEVSTEYASGIVDEAAWQATLLDALQQYSVSLNDAVWVDDDAWLDTSEDAQPQAEEVLNDEAWEADFWAE